MDGHIKAKSLHFRIKYCGGNFKKCSGVQNMRLRSAARPQHITENFRARPDCKNFRCSGAWRNLFLTQKCRRNARAGCIPVIHQPRWEDEKKMREKNIIRCWEVVTDYNPAHTEATCAKREQSCACLLIDSHPAERQPLCGRKNLPNGAKFVRCSVLT